MAMNAGKRSAGAGRGAVLDWLHEQGKRRDAWVPEFDVERILRLVRIIRATDPGNFWTALTPAEREAFRSAAHEQVFSTGSALMRQGEPADEVMVILDGRTTVIADDDGRDRVIARRGPGDMIGESGAAPGNVRSATVVARDTVRALVMTTEDYAVFVSEHFSVPDVVKRHVKGR
jgi:CRP-like cAMP-binding protein